MKKTVIGMLVGVATSAAMVTSSYAQGQIQFVNYAPQKGVNAPITFSMDGMAGPSGTTAVTAGEAVGSEFMADLIYSLDGGATWLTDATSASGYPVAFSGTDGNAAAGAGYFLGPTVTLPSWTSGNVDFIVRAFTGTTYGDVGQWSGESSAFTVNASSIGTTTGTPPGYFGGALTPFSVSAVPEPTTFALVGLGAAALAFFRRRKA